MSGVVRAQGGPVLSVTEDGITGVMRPDYIGGNANLPPDQRTADHWFNTVAFVTSPKTRRGTAGMGIIDAAGLYTWDTSAAQGLPGQRAFPSALSGRVHEPHEPREFPQPADQDHQQAVRPGDAGWSAAQFAVRSAVAVLTCVASAGFARPGMGLQRPEKARKSPRRFGPFFGLCAGGRVSRGGAIEGSPGEQQPEGSVRRGGGWSPWLRVVPQVGRARSGPWGAAAQLERAPKEGRAVRKGEEFRV